MLPKPAAATIHYKISLTQPEEHLFHVTVRIPRARPGTVVAIPAWNALYQIRDFGSRVRDVEAFSIQGEARTAERISVTKLDKQEWRLGEPRSMTKGEDEDDLVARYAIEWDDPGPFDSQLNSRHAFLNLAEVLMYLPERRNEEVIVQLGDVPAGWKVATELTGTSVENGFVAPSYEALVDAPVEAGHFESFSFNESGARFRVVVDGRNWDRMAIEQGLRKIVAYEMRLMGGPPFGEYMFLIHIGPYVEAGGGGMEHANCAAIGSGSQTAVIDIAAHEFFHTWNVKRIRPQSLQPVDFSKEQWTRALWFAEGVTSTYGSFTLLRSGIWNRAQFYSDLSAQIRMLQTTPAHAWQSVEESSLDAWLEKYGWYNDPERSISYYNKGQILGDLLDLAIRDATDNHHSLDDVMRAMFRSFGETGRYYDDSAGIRATVEQVTGKNFDEFFRRYIAGVDEIPYDEYLSVAGLHLQQTERTEAALGFTLNRMPGGVATVARVSDASIGGKSGLKEGDEVLSFDGDRPPRNLEAWLRDHSPGQSVTLRIRRGGQEQDIPVVLVSRKLSDFGVGEIENPTIRQLRIREGFLHGTTD